MDSDQPRWVHHVRDVTMDDDGGDPDCLALVIQDVSDRYEAEERFDAMFQANPAPALIIRLSDSRVVKVNRGFLELTDGSRDSVLGKSLYELELLEGVERRDFAKARLAAGETIPQLEAELPLPGGHRRLVILAGQPIELADERCMLFTFADLEPRRKAEGALKASEEHFATVFRMAPVAMVVTASDAHRINEVNDAFGRMTGYESRQVIGRVADDLQLWNDAKQRQELEAEIGSRGGIRNHDVRVLHRDGHPIECLLSAERISMRGDACVLWLYQDVTARRHSELELVEAIEAVMKDASWFSRSIMDKLATLRHPRGTEAARPVVDLSPREREVLELICDGLDDKTIADPAQPLGEHRPQPCRAALREDRRKPTQRGGSLGARTGCRQPVIVERLALFSARVTSAEADVSGERNDALPSAEMPACAGMTIDDVTRSIPPPVCPE